MDTPETNRQGLSGSEPGGDFSRFLDPNYKIDLRDFPGCREVSSSDVPAGSANGGFHSKIMEIRANSRTEVSRKAKESSRVQEIGGSMLGMRDKMPPDIAREVEG